MLFQDILAWQESVLFEERTNCATIPSTKNNMDGKSQENLIPAATRSRFAIPNVSKAIEDRRSLLARLRGSQHGNDNSAKVTDAKLKNQSDKSAEHCEKYNFPERNDISASNGANGDHVTIEDERRIANNAAEQTARVLSTEPAESISISTFDSSPTLRPDSIGSHETAFRWSLVPQPLNPKKAAPTQQSPLPPTRVYGGSRDKIRENLGVNNVDIGFTFLAPPTPSIRQSGAKFERPARSWRASLNRLSITPSEMPYPINLMRGYDPTDHIKAEEMLGLRRHSQAPPVPPKDPSPSSSSATTSTGSLPLHKESTTEEKIEPLNGRTAWLHALTGMLIVFNSWGITNIFGLFVSYYERKYLRGTSPSAISWIGSVQLALVFGLGVPIGRLVDKGYFRYVFHGGSVLLILGLFCTAFCTQFWQLLLVQGFVTGLGMGMAVCAGTVALMTWWDERRLGGAMGLAAAGSGIGGIVYVLLARHFLETKGFKTTMLVLAGVAAVGLIPPNLVFRIRKQQHRKDAGSRGSRTMTKSTLNWRTFAERSYLLAAGGMFFSFLGVYFGFVYMISFASTELHLSDTAATNLLIFMFAANLPGRFLPALISDRCIGPLNTIIPSLFLSSAIIWLWAVSGEHRESLTVIACFYGFVSAGIQVLYAPTVYTFCLEPVKSASSTEDTQLAMDRMGLKAGGIFTCIGLGCLIGLPIGGALIRYRTDRGLSQPYLGAQIFAGVCLLMGGCLLLGSRVAKAGWAARRA